MAQGSDALAWRLTDETTMSMSKNSPQRFEKIAVGTVLGIPSAPEELKLVSDDFPLRKHLETTWLKTFVRKRLDIKPEPHQAAPPKLGAPVVVDDKTLARHAAVFGASGSGKTRLALHLLTEQLRAGYSAVAMDPKPDTIERLLSCARAAGVKPEQITLLAPQKGGEGVPGWNPLDYKATGVSIAETVSDMVSILEQGASSWGPRLSEVLTMALTVLVGCQLSFYELIPFLVREDYRQGLLREVGQKGYRHLNAGDTIALRESVEYFTREFSSWSKSERVSATSPVLNKVRGLLRVPFLRAMLCTKQNQLDMTQLWQEQRFLIIHLDRTALGDEGVRLLGGLMVWQLYRVAMRVSGPVPVLLSLDEMGVAEKFIGKAAAEILAIARSRGLRLLIACQNLEQLTDDLRSALLANTAFRAFFRLGFTDAKLVAASLAAGTGESIARVSLEKGKGDAIVGVRCSIVDPWKRPLCLSEQAWSAWQRYVPDGKDSKARLDAFITLGALSGIERLYILSPDGSEPIELRRYLAGLDQYPEAIWIYDDDDYSPLIGWQITGPAPLAVTIRFARPKLSVLSKRTESERQQRWLRILMDIPPQQAVIWRAGATPPLVKVVPVPDPDMASLEEFTKTVFLPFPDGKVVEQTDSWRYSEVERIAQGLPPVPVPTAVPKAFEEPAAAAPVEPAEPPSTDAVPAVVGKVPVSVEPAKPTPEIEVADDGSFS